ATPDQLVDGVARKLDELSSLQDEIKALRSQLASGRAGDLAATGADGAVVQRVDGLAPSDLRDLALAVRDEPGVDVVVLAGESTTGGVAIVAAVRPGLGVQASALIRDAAKAVGGGGGGKGDVATAGGKDVRGIPDALRIAADAVASSRATS
ncbi:MAG: DHHA1 domain-containing protein, partial [Ilumatobacteraceae bacterium]